MSSTTNQETPRISSEALAREYVLNEWRYALAAKIKHEMTKASPDNSRYLMVKSYQEQLARVIEDLRELVDARVKKNPHRNSHLFAESQTEYISDLYDRQ